MSQGAHTPTAPGGEAVISAVGEGSWRSPTGSEGFCGSGLRGPSSAPSLSRRGAPVIRRPWTSGPVRTPWVVTCDCPSGKAALGSEGFRPTLDLPLCPATAPCQAHTLIGLGLRGRPTSPEQAEQVLLEPGHGRCHGGFSTSPQMHQQPRWLVHGWLIGAPDQTRKAMLPSGSWTGTEGQLGHPAAPRQHGAAPHRR